MSRAGSRGVIEGVRTRRMKRVGVRKVPVLARRSAAGVVAVAGSRAAVVCVVCRSLTQRADGDLDLSSIPERGDEDGCESRVTPARSRGGALVSSSSLDPGNRGGSGARTVSSVVAETSDQKHRQYPWTQGHLPLLQQDAAYSTTRCDVAEGLLHAAATARPVVRREAMMEPHRESNFPEMKYDRAGVPCCVCGMYRPGHIGSERICFDCEVTRFAYDSVVESKETSFALSTALTPEHNPINLNQVHGLSAQI